MGLGTYAKGVWDAIAGRAGSGALSRANSGLGVPVRDWVHSPRPADSRLLDAYLGVLYTCTNLNAVGVTRVPLRLYATTSSGQARPRCLHRAASRATVDRLRRDPILARSMAGSERVDEVLEHPLLDALDSPCPGFDRESLIDFLVRSLDMLGRAYLRPVAGDHGPAAELWPLPAQDVHPQRPSGKALITGYTYFGEPIAADALIRLRWVSLRDPFGDHLAPAEAAFAYSGLEDKYRAIRDQVLGLGPRPSLLFSPSDKLGAMPGEAERLRFEADLNRKFAPGGAGHARSMVASGAYKVTPLSYPPDGLGGNDVPRYTLERMCNCFGVPVSMITAETNLANQQAADKAHAKNGIEPRCKLVASTFTRRLARPLDPRLFFAFDDAVESDVERDAKVFDVKIKNGSMLVNEARVEDGYEPVPWGDEPPASAGFATSEPAVDPTEASPDPATPVSPSAADVQATALNGAQVASLLEIVAQVTAGTLAPESAKLMLGAAFPNFTAEQIAGMVDAAVSFEPEEPEPAGPPVVPPPTSPAEPDAEKGLTARLTRLLDQIEAERATGPDAGGDRGPDDPPGPQATRRSAQHVWAADGEADLEDAPGVARAAEGGGAGADGGPGGDPGDVPAADGLRRQDGVGHDAADRGLLGRGGEADPGSDWPGPGSVGGREPEHAGEDRDAGPELLPLDE